MSHWGGLEGKGDMGREREKHMRESIGSEREGGGELEMKISNVGEEEGGGGVT